MKYAVVFSSMTGNTKLLADTVREALGDGDCIYFGEPDSRALSADRIYIGFWTDQGTCDSITARFISTLKSNEVFLFGSAGFGGHPEYYDKIISNVKKILPKNTVFRGSFMCQGKMQMSVRERYEKLRSSPAAPPNIDMLIENFDTALSHPDAKDLSELKNAVRHI